jgi:DnaK suppressor protein
VSDVAAGPPPEPVDTQGVDPGLVDLDPVDYDALLGEATRALDDVDHALRRLDDGTYGTCEVCGVAIDEARLEAIPTARTCEDHPQLTD